MSNPKASQQDGRTIHYSVGAVIERDGKVLLIDRVQPPFGWAGPAGHVDEGEAPPEAVMREVKEETGLGVTKVEAVFEEFVEWNQCSKGVKGHYWYLYQVETKGEIKPNRESKQIAWQPVESLHQLKLEPVWQKWFEQLKWL